MDPVPDPEQTARDTLPGSLADLADQIRNLSTAYLRTQGLLDALTKTADTVGVDRSVLQPALDELTMLHALVEAHTGDRLDTDGLLRLIRKAGLDLPPESLN